MADRPTKVLLVDDKEGTRYMVARLLQKNRYEVVEAGTGTDALRLAAEKPDIVILDINLPDISGYEVCRTIKSNPATATIPVMHLSASFADSESRAHGLEGGADGYLTYPIEPRELVASMEALLRTRRAERAAHERGELLRVTLASIGDGVITTDVRSHITSINAIAEALTGWQTTEALGVPFVEVFRVVDQHTGQPIENLAVRAMRDGAILGMANESTLLGRHGQHREIDDSAAPIFDANGEIVGVVVVFRDVTDRRRAEREIARLFAREQRLSHRLRQITTASITINAARSVSSVLRVVTDEARSIVGCHMGITTIFEAADSGRATHTVSLSERFSSFQSPQAVDRVPHFMKSTSPMRLTRAQWVSEPESHALDEILPAMSGLLSAPLVGRNGRNLGCVVLSDSIDSDFSEEDENVLVQLTQAASVAIENAGLVDELRQADRRKDEFLAMLAHELRNPLAPIRNAARVMAHKSGPNDQANPHVAIIERQVEVMVRLVDDLLDVSRITRGQINLRKTPTDLAAIIARAVEGSKPLMESRGHTLTVALPPEVVTVDADAVRLAQVIWNLLNNAAKYSPEKSEIRISVVPNDADATVTIRVLDNGIGIPREMLPKIFDLFTQIEKSLERSQGGLGIGLTLVRRLTEMHGGTAEAFSEGIGCGSEFVVTLPMLASASATKDSSPTAGTTSPPGPRRILVVDDNRDSADSLADLLRLFGNEVRTAYDGPSALTAALSFVPGLVLLDLGLPGASGYDVATNLRTVPALAKSVLVALTGYGTDEDRRRTKAAGFDYHLTKPADLSALQKLLSMAPY